LACRIPEAPGTYQSNTDRRKGFLEIFGRFRPVREGLTDEGFPPQCSMRVDVKGAAEASTTSRSRNIGI